MKKPKILCLSRAPLDYFGGIPAYCVNLYKNGKFDVTTYSYDINKKITKLNERRIKKIKEFCFPSEISFGTFAISFGYFHNIYSTLIPFQD